MIIKEDRYVIGTTGFPLGFEDVHGNIVFDIQDAERYTSIELANERLNKCSEQFKSRFRVMKLEISYEF